jgi:hypothetical protein
MALMGKGVLAIWNGITDSAEAEFIRWHIQEHIPERVGLPGFLRGRRYIAYEGHPKYFNFYETDTVQSLESPAYRDRLNSPTPWTQSVIREFKDTSRTICDVVASLGRGEGAWVEAIQIIGTTDNNAFAKRFDDDFLTAISRQDGIVGVHLLRGIAPNLPAMTAETKLRSQPDARCDGILLIEAAELNFIQALRSGLASDRSLQDRSGADMRRGIYRLQFGLTHDEAG